MLTKRSAGAEYSGVSAHDPLDSDTGLSMSLGETAIISETGCARISRAPRHLLVAKGSRFGP
jgi:hypothetical protein